MTTRYRCLVLCLLIGTPSAATAQDAAPITLVQLQDLAIQNSA